MYQVEELSHYTGSIHELLTSINVKIGPYGPELIRYFGIKLAKSTQLSVSGPYIKAHEV